MYFTVNNLSHLKNIIFQISRNLNKKVHLDSTKENVLIEIEDITIIIPVDNNITLEEFEPQDDLPF